MRRVNSEHSGVISVLAAVASLALVASMTLAVDVGSRTLAARELQGAADVAALDAVRALDDLAGIQSAGSLATASLSAYEGWVDPTLVSVQQIDAGTVEVTASADAPGFVLIGDEQITRSATARLRPPFMSISVGSRLFSVNSSEADLLNELFSEMLGGVELSAVSYAGLMDGELTLRALQQELLDAGYTVGSVDQLLAAQISAADLLGASIHALTPETTSQTTIDALATLESNVDVNLTLALGEIIRADTADTDNALDVTINVFDWVKAMAYVADGDNATSVQVPLSVPGTVQLLIEIALIEPPQIAIGPPGETTAETAQVLAELTLVNPSLKELVKLPATIEGATADAFFADAAWPGCDWATVETTTTAARVNPGDGTGPAAAEGFDSWTGLPPATYSVGYEGGGILDLYGVVEAAEEANGLLGGLLNPTVDLEKLADEIEAAAAEIFNLLGVGVAEADVRLSEMICHGRRLID